MDSGCCGGLCSKCHGAKWIVLGLILLANQYYLMWDIWVLLGALFVLKGIMKLAMPSCSHCQPSMGMKKGRK